MRQRAIVIAMLLCLIITPYGNLAFALNETTHAIINELAARQSRLDQILKELGFLRGIEERVRGVTPSPIRCDRNRVVDWIRYGGILEDIPTQRSARHFHDPTQPWETAGLRGPLARVACGSSPCPSSLRWSQQPQTSGGNWSWQEARRYYETALTTADPVQREQAWANTFRALGHLMHLVTDASVPEHVRNDTHTLESIVRLFLPRGYGNYEYFLSDMHREYQDLRACPPDNAGSRLIERFLPGYYEFDGSILRQPTGDAEAPAPVARLIDTGAYRRAGNPNVTLSPAIGIAEFANANFFSQGTGAWPTYSFPSLDRLRPSQYPAPTGIIRRYFAKGEGDGVPVDPVLAECAFEEAGEQAGLRPPFPCVDEKVWDATARVMLPRALGYSIGLLYHFFRGKIEIAAPDRYVYALASYEEGNRGFFTKIRLKVKNATPDEDTDGPRGRMVAVVQYRRPVGGANLIENPAAVDMDQLFFAVSREEPVTLTRAFTGVTFDFSGSPLPTNSADLFLTVVYRGRLGLEQDAVLVGGKKIFEPDPFDQINITDYDCIGGQVHATVDAQRMPFPRYQPPAPTGPPHPRDPNPPQGYQVLFGPWRARDVFLKIYGSSQPPPTPSENNFDFQVPVLSFAQTARFMLIQDQPIYNYAILVRELQESTNLVPLRNVVYRSRTNGIINRVVLGPDGRPRLDEANTPPKSYRGVPLLHFHVLMSSPAMYSCFRLPDSSPPNLDRAEGVLPRE